jgi:hypothetical protein
MAGLRCVNVAPLTIDALALLLPQLLPPEWHARQEAAWAPGYGDAKAANREARVGGRCARIDGVAPHHATRTRTPRTRAR